MLRRQTAGETTTIRAGMQASATAVLAHLDGELGTTVPELASVTLRTPAEIRRIVGELAEKGLTQPLARARNAVVWLTPEGKKEARRLGLRPTVLD